MTDEQNMPYMMIRATKFVVRMLRFAAPEEDDEAIRRAVLEMTGSGPRHPLVERQINEAITDALAEAPPLELPRPPAGLFDLADLGEDRELPPRIAALLDPAEGWKVEREPGEEE